MTSSIEKRGLDKWAISLFEAHKTTREITDILNAQLEKSNRKPVSQPTISRFLQPYREVRDAERRNIINRSFPDDLEKLNLLIERNNAIANGIDWDARKQVPKIKPDGTYVTRNYKANEQIQASRVAISGILKKFEHLRPEERLVYADPDNPSTEAGRSDNARLTNEQLNSKISDLLAKLGVTADAKTSAEIG